MYPGYFKKSTLPYALLLLGGYAASGQALATKEVTYYYTDPQGTVLAMTDWDGNVVSASAYAPYGSNALGQPLPEPGYTGQVMDTDTTLIYMQGRYMDPAIGRFISTDPKAPSPGSIYGFSRYPYANDNPYL